MVHVQAQKNTAYATCVAMAAAAAICLREGQVPQSQQLVGKTEVTDCRLGHPSR